jgi:hypothetical protein
LKILSLILAKIFHQTLRGKLTRQRNHGRTSTGMSAMFDGRFWQGLKKGFSNFR